uniref:Uncharacterized protein n=1 Tax=Tetraselmis sp. GSL018 TaxID=582737 RepID=A0A061R3Y3_9CHLO
MNGSGGGSVSSLPVLHACIRGIPCGNPPPPFLPGLSSAAGFVPLDCDPGDAPKDLGQ